MLLVTLFIIGHIEVGGGYCRTDMLLQDNSITMEYPCEYYSELRDIDDRFKLLGE